METLPVLREEMLELREEVDDLGKMIHLKELGFNNVLADLDTPVNSDSENDEVRKSVLLYVVHSFLLKRKRFHYIFSPCVVKMPQILQE